MISENDVIDFVKKYKERFEAINLSFFEWTVGLAFDYFSEQKVDVAIVETGLGGRFDSTNVITPELAVITNIGLDHTQFLGDTLALIAKEKAGIIKNKVPVIIGETQKETTTVFKQKALEMNAPIYFTDLNSELNYQTDLKGNYQYKNVKACVQTIQTLKEIGWNISEQCITKGLMCVVENTGLLGRWQTLGDLPTIICDTGHNEEAVREIVAQFKTMTYNKLHIVFGVVNDKSIGKVLDLLPKNARYYYCKANIPRALDVDELLMLAEEKGLKGNKYVSVKDALFAAKEVANSDDLIFVGGSTFVVAEVV